MSSFKFFGVAAFVAAAAGGAAAAAPPADLRARADAIVAAAFPADGPGGAVIITRRRRDDLCGGARPCRRRGAAADHAGRASSATARSPSSSPRRSSCSSSRRAGSRSTIRSRASSPIIRSPAPPRPCASSSTTRRASSPIPAFPAGWSRRTPTAPYSTAEMIALFRDRPSPTPPGQAWAYNNSGYVLLGAIVEQVTGKPWHQAVAERIAGPLGLRDDRLWRGPRSRRGDGARLYRGADGSQRPARRIHMSVPHAAGALVGTAGDLAQWSHALHHGRVVGPALYAAMTTPTRLPEGRTHPYGFGLGFEEVRGRPTIEHGGGIFGFSTYGTYIPVRRSVRRRARQQRRSRQPARAGGVAAGRARARRPLSRLRARRGRSAELWRPCSESIGSARPASRAASSRATASSTRCARAAGTWRCSPPAATASSTARTA